MFLFVTLGALAGIACLAVVYAIGGWFGVLAAIVLSNAVVFVVGMISIAVTK